MKVFSVSAFSRTGSKKSSTSKDDRPFPTQKLEQENGGTYIISSPPRYEHVTYSHAMEPMMNKHIRRSFPDLNSSNGFTIYDDQSRNFYETNFSRKKLHGSHSNPQSPKIPFKNPFQRTRSSSGREASRHRRPPPPNQDLNGLVWPKSININNNNHEYQNHFFKRGEEPIYSEPLPPINAQIREAGRTILTKFGPPPVQPRVLTFPDPEDPVQISNHIYEYLVTRRSDASTQANQHNKPQVNSRRRGSLTSSSSPSSAGSMCYSGSGSGSGPVIKAKESDSTETTSSGEAVHLQKQLRSIGSGLVGIRHSLHENGIVSATDNLVTPVTSSGHQVPPPAQQNYMNVDCKGQSLLDPMAESGPGKFTDAFVNARGMGTEISSVSDPPSSAAAVGNGSADSSGLNNGNFMAQPSQMSPPRPTNNLQQNDYYNVLQPVPIMNTSQPTPPPQRPSGPSSLPSSSRTHSSANGASPASASPFAPPVPMASHPQTLGLPPASTTPTETTAPTGAFSRVRPRTPPQERMRKREKDLADEAKKSKLADMQDLIHLDMPLSEDSVMRVLQSRFFNQKYFTNVGPHVLSVNSFQNTGNPLTLASTKDCQASPEIKKVVKEAIRLQGESGYPQVVIVSGASGSGKTHTSMVVLRQLFMGAQGQATETDTFKFLSASFTVLRSFGTAQTRTNRESSRIGHFIEVMVSDGALYRTKIHSYYLDQSRVVKPLPMEKNYHIFYQLLSGLTEEEKRQHGLLGLEVVDFTYLNQGDIHTDPEQDAERFAEWRSSLSVLGINFNDVVRILAAILLLGNVDFLPKEDGFDVEIVGNEDLESVANLLGVPVAFLKRGLTTRTRNMGGQLVLEKSSANVCHATKNALAKSLYSRTVSTITRIANTLKRPLNGLSGTTSSDSNESVQHEVASHHASTIGTAGSRKSAKSMAILNKAVRVTTEGFIGILDMFGFEDSKPSQLEQLCINLCSETMQHFYNTHVFKSSIESCREEGIALDISVDYLDNVPVIDLISSLRTGLLSKLDLECSVQGSPENYVHKVKYQHRDNKKLYDPNHCDRRIFGIHHFAGDVVYDASDFLDTNRDVISDDVVSVFSRESCNFGFATHIFSNEIKALASRNKTEGSHSGLIRPMGLSFRISHTLTNQELLNGDEPVSTLTQDFHTRLDNLLRTLVHAKPHFVRCISPNQHELPQEFDRTHVAHQIRSLQVLETVKQMSGGFPHRLRFKQFNARYRCLARSNSLLKSDEKAVDDCETILDCYSHALKTIPSESLPRNTAWAHGRKHIFMSEGMRQQLEQMRESKLRTSATLIQKTWRGWHIRRQMGKSTKAMPITSGRMTSTRRPRPQPITGTPPPDMVQSDRCDFKIIQQTCALFGLDLERPPPIPASRSYTICGNKKVTYPHTRMVKHTYSEPNSTEPLLVKGETIVVIGVSPKRGHLIVEKRNHTFHVPFQYLEMKPVNGAVA